MKKYIPLQSICYASYSTFIIAMLTAVQTSIGSITEHQDKVPVLKQYIETSERGKAQTSNKDTPLYTAARRYNKDIIELLNNSAINKNNNTPLHLSDHRADTEVREILHSYTTHNNSPHT